MMDPDFIIISHSEMAHYEKYRTFPLDRIDIYRNLVQLRMLYYKNEFLSHLDVLNKLVYGKSFYAASPRERRRMFSVWNLPSFNGMLAVGELVRNGFICKVINNFDAEIDILSACLRQVERPVVGISSTFVLQWGEISRIAAKIRELAPKAVIIVGGAFINDQYVTIGKDAFGKYLEKYKIDYIVYSFNSEKDLLLLLKALRDGEDVHKVNNLAYIDKDGNFLTTTDCWNEPVLDYPAAAWSHLYSPETMGSTLQLRTTSGCPFSCAFCTYPVTAGGFSLAEADTFDRQLKALHDLGSIKALILIDDTPNVPLPRFRELVKSLRKYNFKWYSFLRVQYIDEQLAADMKASGCDGVYLGLESANDRVLAAMNKKVDVGAYRRGIEILKSKGIKIFANFVLGFPGETEDSIRDNVTFIEETGLDFYSVKEFYYSHNASVHMSREMYGLNGQGNVWQHSTMSSTEASRYKLLMFESVKSSTYVDSDSGLWYLAYLRERGFNWLEIHAIQRIMSEMMSQDNRDDFFNKKDNISDLAKILVNSSFKGKPAGFSMDVVA